MPRPKGSKNRVGGRAVIAKLVDMECDPVELMAKIAMGDTGDLRLRGPITVSHQIECLKTLMAYCYPTMKSLDVNATVDEGLTVQIVKFGDISTDLEPGNLSTGSIRAIPN